MHLVRAVAKLLALLELLDNIWVASRGQEGREPVKAGDDAVLDFARGHVPRPADNAGHAEAAFHHRALARGERSLPAVGPGEVLRPVIRGEDQNRIALDTQILHLLHHRTDDIVELRHASFFYRPAVLGRAHFLVLL